MAENPVSIEVFHWKGQLRYRCPMNWDSGAKCDYDTYDLEQLKKHMAAGHSRYGGLKNEINPDAPNKDYAQSHDEKSFESVKFKDDLESKE